MDSLTIQSGYHCALVLQIVIGTSLVFSPIWRAQRSMEKTMNAIIAYFFSLSPAALLVYLLYKVSFMY